MAAFGGGIGHVVREPLLNASFPTCADLDHALVYGMHPFGLFLQGHDGIAVGQQVVVRIVVEGLEPQLLHGTVVWRRLTSWPGAPPGIGIQFEDSAAAQLGALRNLATSANDDDLERRDEVRRTVRIPIVFLLDADPTIRSGVLADLSSTGARVQTFQPPLPGRIIVLRPRYGARMPAIAARVVWRRDGEAGLAIVADRPAARAAWQHLVAQRKLIAQGSSA